MDTHHSERLAKTLREEVEEIINYELSDPRIGPVAVTEVLLAPDLRQAIVRVSLSGEIGDRQDTICALEGARHHVRRLLAGRLEVYRVPELRFEPDLAPELHSRAQHLLRRIRKGRPREQAPLSSSSDCQENPLK